MFFGMGSKLLYAVTRVALPPLALAHMGLEDYGLWSTCFVLVSYVGMAASGFSLVYLRSAARLHQQGDLVGLSRLLSTGIASMFVLTTALLAGLLLLMPTLLAAFHVETPQRALAQDLWLGAVAVFLADMSIGAFANVLHAIGKIRQEQTVWVAAFLLEALFILCFLSAGWGVRGLLAAFALRYLFSASANAVLAYRSLPGLRLHWRLFDASLLRAFFIYGASMQASGLTATALQSLDRLLAGTLVGPHATALTDLATKLAGTAASIVSSASLVTLASSARQDASGCADAIDAVYDTGIRFTCAGLALTLPFLMAFAPALTLLWLGPKGPHTAIATLMVCAIPGLHLHMLTGPATALTRGRGEIAPDFVYHGLRALTLGAAVTAWLTQGRPGALVGFVIALSLAQSLAAGVFIAWAHTRLRGALASLVQQAIVPTLLAYALALGCANWIPSDFATRLQALGVLAVATFVTIPLIGLMLAGLMSTRRERRWLIALLLPLAGCAWQPKPPQPWPTETPAASNTEALDLQPDFQRTVQAADQPDFQRTAQPAVQPVTPSAASTSTPPGQPTRPESQDQPADWTYQLAPGDAIALTVWGRPELSGRHTIGPDGVITVPLCGAIRVARLTRDEASQTIQRRLAPYYAATHVQLLVEQYAAHRITVLGRVQNPGALQFDHRPRLLEVLARAAALPVSDKQASLVRCAIFRGEEQIVWVDLKRLLGTGNPALNVQLEAGDLVYLPESPDASVYVMGAVARPGAYRLTPGMSLLDALGSAGGPNEDARPQQIALYRAATQRGEALELQALLDGQPSAKRTLSEGDVIYVPKSHIAEFGYVTRQLAAGLSMITVLSVLNK